MVEQTFQAIASKEIVCNKILLGDGTNNGLIYFKTTGGDDAGLMYTLSDGTGRGHLKWNSDEDMSIRADSYQIIFNDAGGGVLIKLSPEGTKSSSAILEAQSTTQGFLPPRMTTTQKNAISSPATGLIVFDTTLAKLCVYTGAAWQTITST